MTPELENKETSSFDEDVRKHMPTEEPLQENEKGVDLSWPTVKRYIITRFTELLPPKGSFSQNKHLLNPFPSLLLINTKQWLFFLIALAGWTWDAFDYFSVSLNATTLAEDFDVTVKDITWGITVVLMLRTVGAVIFGSLGDKYGRKWPFIINLLMMCVLEIGTGFITTYQQFLGIRALFGIIMGGIYGNAAATALDDCPPEARGIVSGMMQQGYALGYLLAVVFTRAIADTTSKSWRALFWFGAGVCFVWCCLRALLPETDAFINSQAIKKEQHDMRQQLGIEEEKKTFWQSAKIAMRHYWLILVYLVLLMAGFNFMSHGSQDLFPTYISKQLQFSADRSTVTNCVANLGAILGGVCVGHFSNFFGRRLSIIVMCIIGGALIYPWAFIHNNGINASVFFLQFCVQGAWGVIPVHLSELSPPSSRAFIVGVSYQLGNLASSASSTIETTIGERFPLSIPGETDVFDYGKVMAIFMGCVFGYVLLITIFGPEKRGADLNADTAAETKKLQQMAHDNDLYATSIDKQV